MVVKHKHTRIQREKRAVILTAALQVFSENGFRGTTLDQIAEVSGLSKPNMLYYFSNKHEIYISLLQDILEMWFAPLERITEDGDPTEQLKAYIHAKMEMSRDRPMESRLFANEILHGAPRVPDEILKGINATVESKVGIIQCWVDQGHIADIDPRHLLFAIWATTQHYADFAVQIENILGETNTRYIEDGTKFLERLFVRGIQP